MPTEETETEETEKEPDPQPPRTNERSRGGWEAARKMNITEKDQEETHAALNVEQAHLNRTAGSDEDFARFDRNCAEIYENAEAGRCQFAAGCRNHSLPA